MRWHDIIFFVADGLGDSALGVLLFVGGRGGSWIFPVDEQTYLVQESPAREQLSLAVGR